MASIRTALATLAVLAVCSPLISPVRAQPATISGQVLLPDGKPAEGVRVFAEYHDPKTGRDVAWVEGQAGAEGRFTFAATGDVGKTLFGIAAVKPGLALASALTLGKPAGDVTLRLGAAPVSLTGTVTDPAGKPVEKAEVAIWALMIGPPPGPRNPNLDGFVLLLESPFLTTATDAQGAFRLDGLPPEATVTLQVVAEHRAHLSVQRDLAEAGPLRIVLPPEATIAGRVTHAGQPVAGLKLGAGAQGEGGGGEAVTGADGTYLMEHLTAGKYNVAVDTFPEGLTAAAVEGVLVHAGDHRTGADLTLTPGALVQGKLTAVGGAPIKGAGVGAYGPAHPESTGWMQFENTTADGTYTIRLPAGHNKLYLYGAPEGYSQNSQPKERLVELKEGETLTGVDFVLAPIPKVHGQVLLPNGKPAAGVAIRLLSSPWEWDPAGNPDITTDAQGAFELSAEDPFGRPMSQRQVQVLAQDADQGLAALVPVADPAPALTLRLAPGAYLEAHAVDLEGKPVPQVPITVHSDLGPPMATGKTDADGRVLLGPLPAGVQARLTVAGRYQYLAATNDWDALIVTPAAGAPRQLPVLRLNPQGRSQAGWVGDAAGKPVAGALVYASGLQEPATTDAQGHFALTGLPGHGTLQIVAAHPTEATYALKEIDPDWGFTPGLELQPTGAVTGQVVDAAGQPVAGIQVHADGPPSGRYAWQALYTRRRDAGFNPSAKTDAEGRFRIEGLLPSVTYQVFTQGEGTQLVGGKREFVVVPGETVDLAKAK